MNPASSVAPTGSPSRSRRTITSYERYSEAEAAVDRLSDRKFPVEALAGCLFGIGLGLASNVSGVVLAFYGLALGAFFGAGRWSSPGDGAEARRPPTPLWHRAMG